MSVPLTINGVTFNYPVEGDTHWGPTLTAWSTAVTNALKPLTGGFLTLSPFPSSGVVFANATNTGFLALTVNGSNQLTFNGTPIGGITALTDNNFFIGNGSNVPVAHPLTGDISTTDTGVVTIAGPLTLTGLTLNGALTMNGNINMSSLKNIILSDGSASVPSLSFAGSTNTGLYSAIADTLQISTHGVRSFQIDSSTAFFFVPLSMQSNKINFLDSGVATGDAVNVGQLNTKLNLSGGTMTGTLNMGSNTLTGLPNAVSPSDAVNFSQIGSFATLPITAGEIAANTITAAQIANNTITATQLANNTVTATQIANNTITASQIASQTITASQIANATITTTQLSAGVIALMSPKSIQTFTTVVTTVGSTPVSVNQTIASVNTAKAYVVFEGFTETIGAIASLQASAQLTSPTNVLVIASSASGTTANVKYTVVEWN